MDSLFLERLCLTFVVGSVWVSCVTVLSEKLGTERGGIIGGVPSTALLSFLFMGWGHGTNAVLEATTRFPLSVAATNALFLPAYSLFSGWGAVRGLTAALAVWSAVQLFIINLHWSFTASLIGWAIAFLVANCSLSLYRQRYAGVMSTSRAKTSTKALITRSLLAGLTIASSVCMAKLAGPVVGSVFAALPAVYLSTLYIIARTSGVAASTSFIPPLMMSGMINCLSFTLVLRATLEHVPFALAILFSLIGSVISALMLYKIRARGKFGQGSCIPS